MGKKKKADDSKLEKLELRENVTYIGKLYDKYTNQECKIIGRSKEWHRVEFEDGKIVLIPFYALKRKEEETNENN